MNIIYIALAAFAGGIIALLNKGAD